MTDTATTLDSAVMDTATPDSARWRRAKMQRVLEPAAATVPIRRRPHPTHPTAIVRARGNSVMKAREVRCCRPRKPRDFLKA